MVAKTADEMDELRVEWKVVLTGIAMVASMVDKMVSVSVESLVDLTDLLVEKLDLQMESAMVDVVVEWMVEQMVDLLDIYMVVTTDFVMVVSMVDKMVVSLVVTKDCLSVAEMADY